MLCKDQLCHQSAISDNNMLSFIVVPVKTHSLIHFMSEFTLPTPQPHQLSPVHQSENTFFAIQLHKGDILQ